MARFVIALNEKYGITRPDPTGEEGDTLFDWIPAVQKAAEDIVMLNQYVGMIGYNPETGESAFPRPIAANPNAVWWVEEQLVPESIIAGYTIPERIIADIVVEATQGLDPDGNTYAIAGFTLPGYTIPAEIVPDQIIPEHIESAHWQGDISKILGNFNSLPTEDGFITIDIDNYEWINFRFLSQVPDTFFYIGGEPTHVGKII